MLDVREARAITEIALGPKAEMVRPYLEHISSKIRAAAETGKRQIDHPFHGMDVLAELMAYPSSEVRAAVQRAFQILGFQWYDHPNPDPDSFELDHNIHIAYTIISW